MVLGGHVSGNFLFKCMWLRMHLNRHSYMAGLWQLCIFSTVCYILTKPLFKSMWPHRYLKTHSCMTLCVCVCVCVLRGAGLPRGIVLGGNGMGSGISLGDCAEGDVYICVLILAYLCVSSY